MNFLRFKKFWPVFVIVLAVIIFFKAFLFAGKLPIPADTIIGLYHPFRDLYARDYPRGIPFKNFLITDPVRQQYPWRELAITTIKKAQLPLWNPYSMAGYPLLGNQQSAVLYPLNVLFFIMPFPMAWSVLIVLEPLLAGIFLYLYLRNLDMRKEASVLGAISFAFSGFSIAWMEWGTVLHSALWLPLILLSVNKIVSSIKYKVLSIKLWSFVFVFALSSSLFAGHLQTFFYVAIFATVYFFARWIQHGANKKTLFLYLLLNTVFLILTSLQWASTFQLIGESARQVDQADWQKEGWFIPWQHLAQFVAPDFFGNPTTLNYWGVWNYGEFVGYIGIFPLIFALSALLFRRDKKTLFFGLALLVSLLFALPTPLAKIPFLLDIPFLATAQPTRLLFIADFSLALLCAFGFDALLRHKKKMLHEVGILAFTFLFFWAFILLLGPKFHLVSVEALSVAKRNLLLPTGLIGIATLTFLGLTLFSKNRKISLTLYAIILLVTIIDLIRFGQKFTPFTPKQYLFPKTETIFFLQNQKGQFRIMATDDRILPPNFSTMYRLQSVDGYDPLYLRRYGELIAASERGKPNISPPFGFNRIITPSNYHSKIIDLLGVRFVLSLSDLSSPTLTKVFQEGETQIYENKNGMPRAFFVKNIHEIRYPNRQEAIEALLDKNVDLKETAIVEFEMPRDMVIKREPFSEQSIGTVEIEEYFANRVVIKTENTGDGFLVLTDSFYPTWKASIDGAKTPIYRTDFNFRGIFVPKGTHTVEFFN